MRKDKYEFTPMSQDDFTEELWDAFQNTWRAEAADILEDCAAKVAKAIKAAQREHIPDGKALGDTRFCWLAMLARLAYLKGHAAGMEARETLLFIEAEDEAPKLDAIKAFAECVKEDDFAEYDFDCETAPGKATAEFLNILPKLPNSEK